MDEEGHTWLDLTALTYHFGTQCIPTPIAWYATQLPAVALQVGVFICFIIELPATLLLIAPSSFVLARRVGAVTQLALQLVFILASAAARCCYAVFADRTLTFELINPRKIIKMRG